MEKHIVVEGWGEICPSHLRYTPIAGEPKLRAYVSRYPYAVIFFKKLKKQYEHEQLCTGVRERKLRSTVTGAVYTRGTDGLLRDEDTNPAPRYKRIVKADAVIEW